MIKSIFEAIAQFFGYFRHRSEIRNAEDIKAAKIGQQDVDIQNNAEKAVSQAIKTGDVDDIRRQAAE